MKKKNNGIFYVVISLVAVLAIGSVAVIAYSGYGTPKVVVEGNYIEAGQTVVAPVEGDLGAVTGPDSFFPITCNEGVCTGVVRQKMKTATTTLCSIKNPFGNATSTLVYVDYQITTGTTTASTIVANPSTLQYASTTVTNIGSVNTVASGATDSWSWNQNTASMDIGEISPDEFLLVQTEPIGLSGFTYTGFCQAGFRKF